MPNVVARFFLEELDEAVVSERASGAEDHIDNDGNFEVVDSNGSPCKPWWENGTRSASRECCDDEFVGNPEEVEPLGIEEDEEDIASFPHFSLVEIVEIE